MYTTTYAEICGGTIFIKDALCIENYKKSPHAFGFYGVKNVTTTSCYYRHGRNYAARK